MIVFAIANPMDQTDQRYTCGACHSTPNMFPMPSAPLRESSFLQIGGSNLHHCNDVVDTGFSDVWDSSGQTIEMTDNT
jgi:hypothetical protein